MSNQENKETKSNRALMIVFVVLAGILLLIGGSIYLSRDRIQENINDTLAPSRDQEMDETGTEEEEAENTEAAQNTGVTQNAEPRIDQELWMAEHQFIGIYKHSAPLRCPCFQPQAEKGITGDHNDDRGQPCAI